MSSSSHEVIFDKRTIDRNIKHNRLLKKDYEQHLANLPDVSSKSVPMFNEDPKFAKDPKQP